jgi:putative heme iron utilization protein
MTAREFTDDAPDLAAEADRLTAFVDAQSSLVLAVASMDEGVPVIGTLPFAMRDGAFWVLASELAAHTRPLLAWREARIALLADQSASRNPFARERAQWAARVESVGRDEERFASITTALRKRHGKTVDLLCQLGDFHLLGFHPAAGSYVNGFGSAFALDGLAVVSQRRG